MRLEQPRKREQQRQILGCGTTRFAKRNSRRADCGLQSGNIIGARIAGGVHGCAAWRRERRHGCGARQENWTDTASGRGDRPFWPRRSARTFRTFYAAIPPSGNGALGDGTFPRLSCSDGATDSCRSSATSASATATTERLHPELRGTGIIGHVSVRSTPQENITPFGLGYDGFTALQPVHYVLARDGISRPPRRQRSDHYGLIRTGRRAGAARTGRDRMRTATRRSTTASCRCSPSRPSRS